jgi:hypothetical protein
LLIRSLPTTNELLNFVRPWPDQTVNRSYHGKPWVTTRAASLSSWFDDGLGSNLPVPGEAGRPKRRIAPFRGSLPQPVEADLALRWKGSASEMTMTTENSTPSRQRAPWNRGRLIGQKRPLKPKDVWTIRVQLQMEGRRRDLAMFNLAIDSKLRGCDLVRLRIDDVFAGWRVRDRATVI